MTLANLRQLYKLVAISIWHNSHSDQFFVKEMVFNKRLGSLLSGGLIITHTWKHNNAVLKLFNDLGEM